MSVPTGSDASTDADESTRQSTTTDADEDTESDDAFAFSDKDGQLGSSDSIREAVTDWAGHWQAWGIAAFSLLVVGWAAFVQPEASPKGYIPIFLGFTALAVGYIYLDEETQVKFASG